MSQKKNRGQKKPKSEIRLAEERFQNCITKRNAFNEESRTIRDERDSLHNQRNKVMKEVLNYRKKMEVNKKTKEKHMKSRDAAMAKVKQFNELKQQKRKGRKGAKSVKDTVQAIISEIMAAENRLETTEMTIAKEREVLEKLSILRRSLTDQQQTLTTHEHLHSEVKELDVEIGSEISKSNEEHDAVVSLARLNKELYKKNKELMKEATHLSIEANKKHEEFIVIRKKADGQHAKAMEMLETLRTHRKTAQEERQARWRVVKDHHKNIKKELYDPDKLESVADEALQELLSGGKINL